MLRNAYQRSTTIRLRSGSVALTTENHQFRNGDVSPRMTAVVEMESSGSQIDSFSLMTSVGGTRVDPIRGR